MNIGSLRHRVTIQSFTEAADATGQVINTFNNLATVWAKVSAKSGVERTNEGTSNIQRTYDVLIRYTGDIKETYKLIHLTRTLNIKSIINIDDRNRTMQLVCTEEIEID